jgi:hypothetical protein
MLGQQLSHGSSGIGWWRPKAIACAQVSAEPGQSRAAGHNPLISPELKIALALGALFLSLLTFAQCARLAVHLVSWGAQPKLFPTGYLQHRARPCVFTLPA